MRPRDNEAAPHHQTVNDHDDASNALTHDLIAALPHCLNVSQSHGLMMSSLRMTGRRHRIFAPDMAEPHRGEILQRTLLPSGRSTVVH